MTLTKRLTALEQRRVAKRAAEGIFDRHHPANDKLNDAFETANARDQAQSISNLAAGLMYDLTPAQPVDSAHQYLLNFVHDVVRSVCPDHEQVLASLESTDPQRFNDFCNRLEIAFTEQPLGSIRPD